MFKLIKLKWDRWHNSPFWSYCVFLMVVTCISGSVWYNLCSDILENKTYTADRNFGSRSGLNSNSCLSHFLLRNVFSLRKFRLVLGRMPFLL